VGRGWAERSVDTLIEEESDVEMGTNPLGRSRVARSVGRVIPMASEMRVAALRGGARAGGVIGVGGQMVSRSVEVSSLGVGGGEAVEAGEGGSEGSDGGAGEVGCCRDGEQPSVPRASW
jgi:hypothetical protein